MVNFEALICWIFKSSTNSEIGRSEMINFERFSQENIFVEVLLHVI